MHVDPAEMQWRWDDLRVFLAAYRGRSLAAAGRALKSDATTVGRRLASLERTAGTRLFHRTLEGIVPTVTAESIFDAACMVERHAELVARRMTGDDAKLTGVVRLAVTDQFASHFLVHQLARFHAAHPAIEIDLVTGDRFADLARGDADLAVRFAPPGQKIPLASGAGPDVLAQKVATIAVAVFASDDYLRRAGAPKDVHDVAGHRLILPRANASFFPGADWFRAVEGRGVVALRTDGAASLAAATAAGLGLCALPVFIAARHANLRWIDAPTTIATRDAWLLVARDLRDVARVVAVRAFLVDAMAREGATLAGAARRKARSRRR